MVVSIILFIFATINNKVIIMGITIGLLIPLLGTMLGAAFVFFMKKDMSPRLQKSLLGIAIQNIPEGAIISMPMCAEGNSKGRSFLLGSLSGIVEPLGGLAVVFLASWLTPILPYMLSFAAGAMCYVVVEELIPEASSGEHSNLSTIGFAIGFVLMMILDVVMG